MGRMQDDQPHEWDISPKHCDDQLEEPKDQEYGESLYYEEDHYEKEPPYRWDVSEERTPSLWERIKGGFDRRYYQLKRSFYKMCRFIFGPSKRRCDYVCSLTRRRCSRHTAHPLCVQHQRLKIIYLNYYHYWDRRGRYAASEMTVAEVELEMRVRFREMFALTQNEGHAAWERFLAWKAKPKVDLADWGTPHVVIIQKDIDDWNDGA